MHMTGFLLPVLAVSQRFLESVFQEMGDRSPFMDFQTNGAQKKTSMIVYFVAARKLSVAFRTD